MFRRPNVLVVAPQRSHTEYVTREVHEHRAPTDESVRLLREMEGKAKDQIIEAIHVGDTVFECVIHTMRMPESGATKLAAVFSLNGKKMTAEYTEHDFRFNKANSAVRLRDAVAQKIATEILIPAFQRYGR